MKISLLSVLFQFVFLKLIMTILGFSGGSDGTESACNSGDLGQEDPPEKGMATHSSIVQWTEEPGRLQPTVSQRVGHN